MLLDPDTGRVTHFVVRKGRFLPRHVIVPVDWAAEMTPDVVRLAAGREQLAALPEYRPDDEIAEKVLEAFRSYPPLRRVIHGIGRYEAPLSPYEEDTVRVLVQDGVVTLEGNVETSAYKSMAALLAREVPGVREVRNLLVSDDQLEPAVVSALLTDPRTKRAVRARVESDLGVITLTGQALDKKARADAERVAYDVPGVRWVVNRLRVQSG